MINSTQRGGESTWTRPLVLCRAYRLIALHARSHCPALIAITRQVTIGTARIGRGSALRTGRVRTRDQDVVAARCVLRASHAMMRLRLHLDVAVDCVGRRRGEGAAHIRGESG